MVKEPYRGAGSLMAVILGVMAATSLGAGCAITDPGHSSKGGSGEGGTGASGGPGVDASAGKGVAASGGAGVALGCELGSRRCTGDIPQACQDDGSWLDEEACPKGEACSGAGVCAKFRLVGGGIGTFGERPTEPVPDATLILKAQSLSAAPRACTDQLCITGDLR